MGSSHAVSPGLAASRTALGAVAMLGPGSCPRTGKSAALKALKKEQARQRCFAFVKATYVGKQRNFRLDGLAGADSEHDEQWWFDFVDADRKRRNWHSDAERATA
jgi:hypothetical protein